MMRRLILTIRLWRDPVLAFKFCGAWRAAKRLAS
jgi:hypothetical protein